MRPSTRLLSLVPLLLPLAGISDALAQTVSVDPSGSGRRQSIDGFGTCLSGTEAQEDWWQTLYLEDLEASIVRFDLVPRFRAPYSDFTYNSPWFHSSPSLPGPDGNNVRTYTNASDYTRDFGGRRAQIAVMGPDIEANLAYFDFGDSVPRTAGELAQAGLARRAALGDFKVTGSLWSPAPWLKVSSGNTISGHSYPLPVNGAAWPFVWAGNFSGGELDTSGAPRAELDDSAQGGTGPTSALTQFARGFAAYLRGFQRTYGVSLYSVSIQNELNFETFYNSCSYPLSSGYIAAVKAARAELDRHDDLRGIRIMGPEDLLGGDGYGMWQYGGGSDITHKNLQYLANIAADPEAASAIDYFCIHGYAPNGVSSAGSDPVQWEWWAEGWSSSPASGLPASARGFTSFGKKSWMTETSGEATPWLAPAAQYPSNGGFSIAVKIHQALTAGQESAWIYWQLTDGATVGDQTLTDATLRESSPKYVAAKHFFKYIRPGAVRAATTVNGASALLASAYVHDDAGTLTLVLINTSDAALPATVTLPGTPSGITSFAVHTSADGALWQASTVNVAGASASMTVPGYGVVTLVGAGDAVPDAGTGGTGGASGAGDAGPGGSGGTSGPDGGVSAGGSSVASGGALGASGGRSGSGTGGRAGTAGASTGSGGSSSPGGAAGGAIGGPAPVGGSSDDGGCGCRSVATGDTPPRQWLLVALGAVLLVARRARHRAPTHFRHAHSRHTPEERAPRGARSRGWPFRRIGEPSSSPCRVPRTAEARPHPRT